MVSAHDTPRYYELGRPKLAIVDALELIANACRKARGMHPSQAAWQYKLDVLGLLPAVGRDHGEAWQPEADATADDWARLGAYLGAIDGRAQAPFRTRDLVGLNASVYLSTYSMAYAEAARASSWPHLSAKGVARG